MLRVKKLFLLYNGPFPRLRSLLCLVQRRFPLLTGVVLSICQDGVGNFEVAVRCTSVADCVPSTIKLLLHRGLADWAKERPGQRSIPNSLPNQYHDAMSVQDTTASGGTSGR